MIQSLAKGKNIIVVGHQPYISSAANRQPTQNESTKITLGYIGSDNDSNTDAINQFLEIVWERFKDNKNLSLKIAGNVSDRIDEHLRYANVKLSGTRH